MIRINGTTITMPVGDTGMFSIRYKLPEGALPLDGDDRVVFAIYDNGEELLPKTVTPVDGVATFNFANADTENLTPGTYQWDARLVIDAVLTDGVVTGGLEVHSPFAIGKLPKFVLKEVGADV